MHKRHKDNSEAVEAFLAKKAEIDTMLARLTALSAEHFNTDPDTLHWGHLWTAPVMQELSSVHRHLYVGCSHLSGLSVQHWSCWP